MSSTKDKAMEPPSAGASEPAGMPAPVGPTATPEPDGATPSASTAPPAESRSPAVTEPPLTPERLAALQAKAAQADEHWDRLLRAKADLDNYRKRSSRERHEAVRFANLSLMEKLIPVLDSLDKALTAAETANGNGLEALKAGITMVHSHIKKTLAEAGLQEIDATDQPFDPKVHEAVSQQESAGVPEGHVLLQLRKGYRLHERLIRPAAVVVAKKPAA